MYGNLSNAKRSLDASNGDWISTDAQELFVMYLSDSSSTGYSPGYSTDYSSGSGSGESPPDIDYIFFTEPEGEFSHLRSLPLNTAGPDFVTFSIEVKCEPMLTVLEAIDLQAAVEVDEVMLGKMKLLDTVEDVTQF